MIRERGVAATGLDEVGTASATSRSQLFHYFPGGKAELLVAVARHEAEQVLADQEPLLADLTTWRKWQAWRRRVIECCQAQGGQCPLATLTAQLGPVSPEARQIAGQLYEAWHARLAAGVRALKDAGEIDATVRPDVAATAILTAIQGGVSMLQATDRLGYLEVALAEAVSGLRRPHSRGH
jgi:AcrR family transcriptional regulator